VIFSDNSEVTLSWFQEVEELLPEVTALANRCMTNKWAKMFVLEVVDGLLRRCPITMPPLATISIAGRGFPLFSVAQMREAEDGSMFYDGECVAPPSILAPEQEDSSDEPAEPIDDGALLYESVDDVAEVGDAVTVAESDSEAGDEYGGEPV